MTEYSYLNPGQPKSKMSVIFLLIFLLRYWGAPVSCYRCSPFRDSQWWHVRLKAIKDHGGITFAQDEASAAYEGMPQCRAGRCGWFHTSTRGNTQKFLEVTRIKSPQRRAKWRIYPFRRCWYFKQSLLCCASARVLILPIIKQTTIRRRILRRIALNKDVEPATYLKYLRENKSEQDVLYQDLLIPVTGFFRDPKTFDHLIEKVFTHLIKPKQRRSDPHLGGRM